MAFNFYDTHTLLASVQQLPPLHSFLLDRYFPTNAASDVFATDDVLVEYRKGSKESSTFCSTSQGRNHDPARRLHHEALHSGVYCTEAPTLH